MRIEIDTHNEVLFVDDVAVSLDVLRTIVQPDPNRFYQFQRKDSVVTATIVRVDGVRVLAPSLLQN